jgi:hypothetical protein
MNNIEQAFDRANKAAEAYALTTTSLQHAEAVLTIAHQYKSDPEYIKRLEAHVAALRGDE